MDENENNKDNLENNNENNNSENNTTNNNESGLPNNKIEVIIGDSSELKFSEVGDYMGDLKPQVMKGSKKNIIIPTGIKSINKETDEKDNDANSTQNEVPEKDTNNEDNQEHKNQEHPVNESNSKNQEQKEADDETNNE